MLRQLLHYREKISLQVFTEDEVRNSELLGGERTLGEQRAVNLTAQVVSLVDARANRHARVLRNRQVGHRRVEIDRVELGHAVDVRREDAVGRLRDRCVVPLLGGVRHVRGDERELIHLQYKTCCEYEPIYGAFYYEVYRYRFAAPTVKAFCKP